MFDPLQYQTEGCFFFPLFFSPSLHIHKKLTNSTTCPSMLSSRAHSFNTFSTNLDLFHQPDKEILASWGAFWHKASQLKALKKNFSHCCVDTDLHGGRVGFALVLRGSESIFNVHLSAWRRESVRKNPKANPKPEFLYTCQRSALKTLHFWPEVCVLLIFAALSDSSQCVADVWFVIMGTRPSP